MLTLKWKVVRTIKTSACGDTLTKKMLICQVNPILWRWTYQKCIIYAWMGFTNITLWIGRVPSDTRTQTSVLRWRDRSSRVSLMVNLMLRQSKKNTCRELL